MATPPMVPGTSSCCATARTSTRFAIICCSDSHTSATSAIRATARQRPWPTAPKSAAATASAREASSRRSRKKGCSRSTTSRKHTKAASSCGSCCRPLRADPLGDDRRSLHAGGFEPQGGLRLHRLLAPGSARRDSRAAPAEHRRHHALPRMADARRLRQVPPGAELLPDLDLAERGQGRSALAPDQRTRARQHPEGRYLFGGPAHVGWVDHSGRVAPHRRCRRQVPGADDQGHRRPAHRPARDQEGRPDQRLEGSRHALGSRLRQVDPHRQDLRRLEHCRFGTQLAMAMGVKLEKMLFDMYSPHKVKLAVSGVRATVPRPASRTSA
jgi:hypothetical protein